MHGRSQPFGSAPVSPDQVEKIISSLKNSKASGVDMVDTYVLKLVKVDIVPAVCHIINLSLQTNKFPTNGKLPRLYLCTKAKAANLNRKTKDQWPFSPFSARFFIIWTATNYHTRPEGKTHQIPTRLRIGRRVVLFSLRQPASHPTILRKISTTQTQHQPNFKQSWDRQGN